MDEQRTTTMSEIDRTRGQAERYAQETRNKADGEASYVRTEADRYDELN